MTTPDHEQRAIQRAQELLEKRYQERMKRLEPKKEQKTIGGVDRPEPVPVPPTGAGPRSDVHWEVQRQLDQATKDREAARGKLEREHAQERQNLADARGKSQDLTSNQIARDAMVGYEPPTAHPDRLTATFNVQNKAPERDQLGWSIDRAGRADDRLSRDQRIHTEQRLQALHAQEQARARELERRPDKDHEIER